MLDKAITFLQKHLNEKLRGDTTADRVALVKLEKDFVTLATEAVTILLINLEPEPMSRAADMYRAPAAGGGSGFVHPELRLNLYVLFAARFAAYENSLAYISRIIRYFQQNPVLTTENAPEMDPELGKLVFELYGLALQEQNDLWNVLKIAHTPSVLYRIRMVVFEEAPDIRTPAITELDQKVNRL